MIKIPKTVYDIETVELQDGTEVDLKPLSIARLKKFGKALREHNELRAKQREDEENPETPEDAEERELSGMVDLTIICLEKEIPELCADREALEDALDTPTIDKVLELCAGITKPDPNLLMAAMKMAQDEAEAGKNSTSDD